MERHVTYALCLLAIVTPSMVLSAPTLLEKLMDVNMADGDADPAFGFEKRAAVLSDDDNTGVAPFRGALRERRAASMAQCMTKCWFCIKTLTENIIQLGNCMDGCAGRRSRLQNPLDAQSWSTCKENHFQSK